MSLSIPEQRDDLFDLQCELGRGGDGLVFLAYDRRRGFWVVLKQFWHGPLRQQQVQAQAIERLKQLSPHPSLPTILDYGVFYSEGRSHFYYTRSCTPGEPGERCLALSPVQVAQVARLLAEALAALHGAGLCHGDVKPHNLLIHAKEGVAITLIDFGLLFHHDLTLGTPRGTPGYLAPELLLNRTTAQGAEGDLYGLGATLYYLLYGRPPYTPPSRLDRESVDVILRSLPPCPPAQQTPPRALDARRAWETLNHLLPHLLSSDAAQRRGTFVRLRAALNAWASSTSPARSSSELTPTRVGVDEEQAFFKALIQDAEGRRFEGVEVAGQALVALWSRLGQIEQPHAQAFKSDIDADAGLTLDWATLLAACPSPGDEASSEGDQRRAVVLTYMALSSVFLGRENRALVRLKAVLPLVDRVCAATPWLEWVRALSIITWRHQSHSHVCALLGRLTTHSLLLERLDPEQRTDLMNLYITTLHGEERYDEAILVGERTLFASDDDLSEARLKVGMNLTLVLYEAGRLEDARYHGLRNLALCREHQDPFTIARQLITLGQVARQLGQPYQGLGFLEESWDIVLKNKFPDSIRSVACALEEIYQELGLREQAIALYRHAGADLQIPLDLYLARSFLEWGQIEEARDLIRAREERGQVGTQLEGVLTYLKGHLFMCDGKLEASLMHIERCLESLLSAPYLLVTLCLKADVLLRLERFDQAGETIDRIDQLVARGFKARQAHAQHLRARLMLGRGDKAGVMRLMQRARALLDEELSAIPDSYHHGYLSLVWRQQILEDARTYGRIDARLLDGMRRVMALHTDLLTASHRNPEQTLKEVLDQCIVFLGAKRGMLFEVSQALPTVVRLSGESSFVCADHEVGLLAARGFGQQELLLRESHVSHTVITQLLREGAAIWTADAIEDKAFTGSTSLRSLNTRSILAFPFYLQKEINGLAYFDSPNLEQFHSTDAELLQLLGDQLGPVIDITIRRARQESVSRAFPQFIGHSKALLSMLDSALRWANVSHPVPILITGETGTGKGLLASAIHQSSVRSRKAFVAINCAALPEALIEAELLGAAKGAYTGAFKDHLGVFEQAHTGTLFLDEIGDLSLSAQAKLLRVLEDGQVRRLGDTRVREVDVRVIAATNLDLPGMIESGHFRADLYYRLNVLPLHVPPLRQRREDIPELLRYFFNIYREQHELSRLLPLTHDLIEELSGRPWPGNVRQLRNALHKAVLSCHRGQMTQAHFTRMDSHPIMQATAPPTRATPRPVLTATDVASALREVNGNKTQAAKQLGISRRHLYRLLEKFGLPQADPQTP